MSKKEAEGEKGRSSADLKTWISDAKIDSLAESPFITASWRFFVKTLADRSWQKGKKKKRGSREWVR